LDADLHFVQDGEKAIRFIEQADGDTSAPCPCLLILDINLPKRHGREVLRRMRQSRCTNAAVLVVTSSSLERDRQEMGRLGANEYFCKPSAYEEFLKLGDIVRRLLGEAGSEKPAG